MADIKRRGPNNEMLAKVTKPELKRLQEAVPVLESCAYADSEAKIAESILTSIIARIDNDNVLQRQKPESTTSADSQSVESEPESAASSTEKTG